MKTAKTKALSLKALSLDSRVEALDLDLRVVASSLAFDMQGWLGLPAC